MYHRLIVSNVFDTLDLNQLQKKRMVLAFSSQFYGTR